MEMLSTFSPSLVTQTFSISFQDQRLLTPSLLLKKQREQRLLVKQLQRLLPQPLLHQSQLLLIRSKQNSQLLLSSLFSSILERLPASMLNSTLSRLIPWKLLIGRKERKSKLNSLLLITQPLMMRKHTWSKLRMELSSDLTQQRKHERFLSPKETGLMQY